jgi:transketolase
LAPFSYAAAKPLDVALLTELFSRYRRIAVLEEHGLAGGAGSAVLEWGCSQGVDLRKLRCFAGTRSLPQCLWQPAPRPRAAIGLEVGAIVQTLVQGWEG